MLRLHSIKCSETTRANTYQTGARIHDLVPFLLSGHDPRSQNWKNLPEDLREMYEALQRKTSPARRQSMKNYILRRMGPKSYWIGGVPPIVVGMQLFQRFERVSEDKDDHGGYLRITTRLDRPNILLDGLGRVTGFLDVMYDSEQPEEVRIWAGEAVIPVMLVTPLEGENLSLEALGQLFHDMNTLSTPVGKGQAVDLDHSDLYIQTVNEIAQLSVLREQGGCDPRGQKITKAFWTNKVVLLKAVRAAAEGPGSHVDHIRDSLVHPYLNSGEKKAEVSDFFEQSLREIINVMDGQKVPLVKTLLRTATWWVAFGLILNDLYIPKEGRRPSDDLRKAMLRRIGEIDWGLGNPQFGFLGTTVAEKDGTIPQDQQGRPVINRFYGGSKAYYNLAAFIRHEIDLHKHVPHAKNSGATESFGESSETPDETDVFAAVLDQPVTAQS